MKCIGNKNNGDKCNSQARKDFFTCITHRDQEPGVDAAETKTDTIEGCAPVTFGSISANYAHVIQPRKIQAINDQMVEVQPSIRADFSEGRFTTDDPQIIKALRGYIKKNPNDKFLFEH